MITIIGGGLIGLSIAEYLTYRNCEVQIFEKNELGQEASWAAAGYLDFNIPWGEEALFSLCKFSYDCFPEFIDRIKQESTVDPEYVRSGSLTLGWTLEDEVQMKVVEDRMQKRQIDFEWFSKKQVQASEPDIASDIARALYLPVTRQVRSPRLLQALTQVLNHRQVLFHTHETIQAFHIHQNRVESIETSQRRIPIDQLVIASGAWTSLLLNQLGMPNWIKPIRGQAILFYSPQIQLKHILFTPTVYVVPRLDGRIFVGSTLEDVGFDKSVTSEGLSKLKNGARKVFPKFQESLIEKTWSGLRPKSVDEYPILGKLSPLENVWMASGHYKHGIVQAPGTARLITQSILNEQPELSLDPFLPQRLAI
jgi:glycine oxidase